MVQTTKKRLVEQRRRLAAILDVLDTPAAVESEAFFETVDGQRVADTIASISEQLRDSANAIALPAGPNVDHGSDESQQEVGNIKRLESQLAQARKMESLGLLASGVAHDFNNILMGILGSTNIALDALGDPARARYFLAEAIGAAESGAAITKQILAFARKSDGQRELIDLHSVIEKTRPLLSRLLGSNIDCIVEASASFHHVLLSRGNAEQLLVNLAVNARDAMPSGGRLTIETRSHPIDGAAPRWSSTSTPGPYVILEVEDTGSGMTEDVRRRIFEPFFTTKGAGNGTGLGLSTILGIVRQARGHIDVESTPCQGTTFTIFLPSGAPSQTPGAS